MENDIPQAALEIARHLLQQASIFAAAAINTCQKSYPEETAALVDSNPIFAVRISAITSPNPRVALVREIAGEDFELFHVDLRTAPHPGSLLN